MPKSPKDEGMQVLIIDIETRPNLAHVWRLWDQNVSLNQLIESAEMICWAAKWLDDPIIRFKSVHHHGRVEMITTAWNLLDRADAVMHYNGKRFDVPHLNREFLEIGLTPPAPYKQIDLLNTVKRQFLFPSNKLAYVSEALGLGSKVDHEGHTLWVKCMADDPKAWKRMREYNEQDVLLLEKLYERLLPWIIGHPSHGAMNGEDVCPTCGSDHLQARGTATTKLSSYQRYQCQDCGKWSRGTQRDTATKITEVTS